jgi:hypothetical protein
LLLCDWNRTEDSFVPVCFLKIVRSQLERESRVSHGLTEQQATRQLWECIGRGEGGGGGGLMGEVGKVIAKILEDSLVIAIHDDWGVHSSTLEVRQTS